jgi:hypothetical protein
MTNLQIENLYVFYFLYCGVDSTCNLPKQSPDYLLEKWNKLIGVNPPDTEYPEIENSEVYQEWYKTWVREGKSPIPDSMMMFLLKTHPKTSGKYSNFLHLVNTFQKYIGKTYEITQEEYNHIHPVLLKSVQNVIETSVKDEDVRDIILNNMLS